MKKINPNNEKFPDPKELEKELGDFLTKRFGGSVKLATPVVLPQSEVSDTVERAVPKPEEIDFDLKPEELVAFLDQYIIKQHHAKAILATKICTHFNRIRHMRASPDSLGQHMVGSIKNNVLMLGPTGVGKTYMIRLIAQKIGVPFVKGDATKFSETGYVGGDVEDLVRDLVREANGDIDRAQYGIIYIDEIDKIASANNLIGADVSRTGVQRALLKPMEETDVDLKVPHDPISMLQEIERFRKTGQRENSAVNTRNILFIMSGAFGGLDEIIKKRLRDQSIGFNATFARPEDQTDILTRVKSEDLIRFGFESEFVGRLPVRAVFEHLTAEDLLTILENPNNPIILGKKLDFAAYGITAKFGKDALRLIADQAFDENTGARGLVSAVEQYLLRFETRLPSTKVRRFAISGDVIEQAQQWLDKLEADPSHPDMQRIFEKIRDEEKQALIRYVKANKNHLSDKFGLPLTAVRVELIAEFYATRTTDINGVFERFTHFYEQVKTIEMQFLKKHGINIVFEEEAIDHIIAQWLHVSPDIDAIYQRLSADLEYGLKLVREKTGRNRFFLTRQALEAPEAFISQLLKKAGNHLDDSLQMNDTGADQERTDTP
jgi:ATP-dependent Clp protease ATP-binding subunit ClpX